MTIRRALSDEEIASCFSIMVQLRSHLTAEEFVERVKRQIRQDAYTLVYIEDNGTAKAVAGYRILEMLSRGRFMYVDDFVTDAQGRRKGYGRQLFRWLAGKAKEERCERLHLDSGVQRTGAHAFYVREGMSITAYHFGMDL